MESKVKKIKQTIYNLAIIPTRYPNGLLDLTPSEVFTEEEASKAVESSTIILEEIKKILQNQLRFSYENNKI